MAVCHLDLLLVICIHLDRLGLLAHVLPPHGEQVTEHLSLHFRILQHLLDPLRRSFQLLHRLNAEGTDPYLETKPSSHPYLEE